MILGMDPQTFILTILVGTVAGWIAGFLRKGSGYGLFGDAIIGFLGAMVANYIFSKFGISFGLPAIPELLLKSVFGSMLLLGVFGIFTKSN
jgi:uncharacterized membrane protein YeaQ/YmgE (transglycosylase-associated protein family)